MSQTANYGLFVTDDSSTKFLDWRNQMGGVSNSNMVKIDAALAEKAEASRYIELILLASAWRGTGAPYQQTLAVEGMTTTQNGTIAVSQSANINERIAAREAFLAVTAQEEGKLTISADGKLPDINIPVTLLLIG